jgi:alpha-D-ribose 1-methylphosphonate 5-triphosphate synthase subunit PhnH
MAEQSFDNPVLDAQRIFRTVLTALSEPGRVLPIDPACTPPAMIDPAGAAIVLALCDADTPIWLAPSMAGAASFFRFHLGAPIVAASEALFLFARADERPKLASLCAGSPDYPDRSATLILSADDLEEGVGWQLSGPGIAGSRRFLAQPLDASFPAEWQTNHARFPQGVDILFTARNRIAGLPRSTRMEV